MEKNEHFSKFKKPGAVGIRISRKVLHSVTNKWKASSVGGKMAVVGGKATFAAGTTSSVATILATCAGAISVMAGPVAAMVLGVIGIIQTAIGLYSNREKAHEDLTPYVWSYLDSETPSKITNENKDKVAAAALALILGGQSQMAIAESKYRAVDKKYDDFEKKYKEITMVHREFQSAEGSMRGHLAERVVSVEETRYKFICKEFGRGGAAFEMSRRLIHRGNYLQAHTVFAKILQEDLTLLDDFAVKLQEVKKIRDKLAEMSEKITLDDKAVDDADELLIDQAVEQDFEKATARIKAKKTELRS